VKEMEKVCENERQKLCTANAKENKEQFWHFSIFKLNVLIF